MTDFELTYKKAKVESLLKKKEVIKLSPTEETELKGYQEQLEVEKKAREGK